MEGPMHANAIAIAICIHQQSKVLLGSQAIPQSARPWVHYNHDDALLASCILDYGGVLLLLLPTTTFPPMSGGEPIDP
jgi:hypothetical protein